MINYLTIISYIFNKSKEIVTIIDTTIAYPFYYNMTHVYIRFVCLFYLLLRMRNKRKLRKSYHYLMIKILKNGSLIMK